jgi:hypothetical protein
MGEINRPFQHECVSAEIVRAEETAEVPDSRLKDTEADVPIPPYRDLVLEWIFVVRRVGLGREGVAVRPVFARDPVKVELVDVGTAEIVLVVEAEEEEGVERVDNGCAPAKESAQS